MEAQVSHCKFAVRAGPIGFFWLGYRYFIWGGQPVGFPTSSPMSTDAGHMGFLDAGFMQFLTGLYLLTGLTWFTCSAKRLLYTWRAWLHSYAFTGSDVLPAIYRFQRPAGWLDGDTFLFLSILA